MTVNTIISLFQKKKRKINGTPNKSLKRKRNDVAKWILSNTRKRKRNYVNVEQEQLVSNRKRNDTAKGFPGETKDELVNLSNHLFDEDKLLRNDVGKCFPEESETEKTYIQIGDTVNLSDLLFTKNRDYLITGNHQNTNKLVKVKAKDLEELAIPGLPSCAPDRIWSVSINGSNSRMFVSGSCDATAHLWDTRVASRAVRTFYGHLGMTPATLEVYSLDWTPEKNCIVSASQDGRLIVWNALTSQKTHAIKLPCLWVMSCAFSPSGQSVACGGLDSICSIFNPNSFMDKVGNVPVSRMLSGHKGYVSSCQYVPDEDTHLITSSGDHTCILWDITTGLRTSVLGGEFQSGHTADVLSISINGSNSRMFVSGSGDATAHLWDTRVASRAVRTFYGHEGDVSSVKYFPDGNRFGTGSEEWVTNSKYRSSQIQILILHK
ncbi:hypothetical protein POM88_043169 [Heracleum sosnowskyi]|uniref:Uncharacterized protein n=1 Tax=Heracleum sosnowskyi TaxID=360622 RepID=A0AAD8M1R8_9APIA|nr:hypothetical protein POM88_043169 [Heracleum sosnowskyi]